MRCRQMSYEYQISNTGYHVQLGYLGKISAQKFERNIVADRHGRSRSCLLRLQQTRQLEHSKPPPTTYYSHHVTPYQAYHQHLILFRSRRWALSAGHCPIKHSLRYTLFCRPSSSPSLTLWSRRIVGILTTLNYNCHTSHSSSIPVWQLSWRCIGLWRRATGVCLGNWLYPECY